MLAYLHTTSNYYPIKLLYSAKQNQNAMFHYISATIRFSGINAMKKDTYTHFN